MIRNSALALALAVVAAFTHPQNSRLSGLGDTTLLALGNVARFDTASGVN